jgi:ankyrin repeat protein
LFVDTLKGMSRKQIDNALESFPINLDDVYKDAIERIQRMNEYERELGFMVLSLLACARRPLTLLELQGALAVMPRLSHEHDEEDWIYEKDEILKSTAGLIDIDNHEHAVRLSHGSIRDSFVRNGVGGKHFLEAEVDVAIACVTYLNNDAFSERCSSAVEFETRRDTYPFIAYASQHWGHHIQKAIDDPQLKTAAVRLLQNPRRVDAFMQAQWLTDDSSGSWDVRKGVHGLHICAKFGLYPLIPALVQKGDDVNVKEEQYGQTPLMYACRDGYIETIQKLLDLDAEVNIISKRGRTALFEAIINNHVEVVNVLLTRREREIEINASIGGQGQRPTRTALLLAVELGRRNIALRLLQQHGINVDQKDSGGYTALSIAAITGQTEMVQDLLGTGKIEVDHVDEYGRSALYFAAERGYTDIVRDLLQKHANPDLPDSDGNTALMQAVDQEHIDLVETMLGHHPNLQWRNSNGCYLLHLISEKDWPELVRTLVKQGADPNKTDNDGLTPLHYAARSGCDKVVKMLLEEGADGAKEDSSGMTPEQFAAAYGCIEVVKTLRGSEAVPEERTPPIWRLAKEGRTDVIKSAIEASKEDLSETEPVTENSALHCAVQNDQVEIVRMLLEDGRMDPNARNRDLCTPLLFAAEREDLAVVEELLKRHADPDLADRYGNTPLYLASQRPCEPVPIALVEGGAEIDPKKVDVQDLFFKAVELGKPKATEILLHSGADSWEKNHLGMNAQQVAKEGGNNHLIQLLNSRTWSQKPEAWGTAEMSKQADGQLASPLAGKVTTDDVFLPFRAVENLAFDERVPSLDIDKSLFLAEDSRPEDVPGTNRAAAEQYPDDPSSIWWPEAPKREPSGKDLGKNPRIRMLA